MTRHDYEDQVTQSGQCIRCGLEAEVPGWIVDGVFIEDEDEGACVGCMDMGGDGAEVVAKLRKALDLARRQLHKEVHGK